MKIFDQDTGERYLLSINEVGTGYDVYKGTGNKDEATGLEVFNLVEPGQHQVKLSNNLKVQLKAGKADEEVDWVRTEDGKIAEFKGDLSNLNEFANWNRANTDNALERLYQSAKPEKEIVTFKGPITQEEIGRQTVDNALGLDSPTIPKLPNVAIMKDGKPEAIVINQGGGNVDIYRNVPDFDQVQDSTGPIRAQDIPQKTVHERIGPAAEAETGAHVGPNGELSWEKGPTNLVPSDGSIEIKAVTGDNGRTYSTDPSVIRDAIGVPSTKWAPEENN